MKVMNVSISLIMWPLNNVCIDQNITTDLEYKQIYVNYMSKLFFKGKKMHDFLKIYFYLEDNCFTMLCWFLPYINMNQP